jgi:flagellar protein FliS
MLTAYRATNEYKQASIETATAYADPHTLISMLFSGLQQRLLRAQIAIERKDYAEKGVVIGQSIDIVCYLQDCLDKEQGGEIAMNLESLYNYIREQLVLASANNDVQLLASLSDLVKRISSGWEEMRQQLPEFAVNKADGEGASSFTSSA